jgi:hypothetical protein
MSVVPIPYDPQDALTSDFRTYLVENRDTQFIIPCVDGEVALPGRWLLINLIMCMPLIKRHRPIHKKHLLLEGIYGAAVHADRLTLISRTLEDMGYTREELGHDIIMTANNLLNLCYTHMGSFIRTMDIFAIADTILQDEVKPICTMDYGDIEDGNINRMETAFKKQSNKVDELLSGSELKNNVFYGPLICGALKKGQFHQFILSAGPRTDTDDHIFLRPVVGSFLSGMRDILDHAIESRSASKATHYNKRQMSNTQYVNRKIHIQNSVMWHLYPGDCGSTVYGTYEPCKKTVKHFIGKFFLSDGGELLELTEERYDMVIGKSVKFRDVPECLWTDGFCEVCGGTITKSFSKNGNVGFLSNVNTGAPVAQQVLSTKHLISTDAAEYDIPYELQDVLMSTTNDIFLRPSMRKRTKTLALGFQQRDISKINDLQYYVSEKDLHAAYFTDIKYMTIGEVKEDGKIEKYGARTSMSSEVKTYPHLSPEILSIIRKHPEDLITQDGVAWLMLRNIDPEAPVMQCTVVNNSIKRFVDKFRILVNNQVERYTSMNDFMRDLTRLIWPRVNTHVTHVSCLARACLVTSKSDFQIPEMTNPDEVMFGTLGKIIPMRSVGALAAFERFNIATTKPVTFITHKNTGILDEYMGYQDLIERDENWPLMTGSPLEVEPL